jgi:hypothetical protein
MNWNLLFDNLTNPALLFFFLGILAVRLKSDLEIPRNSSRFIALYLLFSIGFKGGQELSHSPWSSEIFWSLVFGIILAIFVPLYSFFLLKKKVGVQNAGAIAASYGSVSAVTFVTAISFLDVEGIQYGGHMVAVMALMEAPAIIVGVVLMALFSLHQVDQDIKGSLRHALTNGSVLLILGSLLIGYIASEEQAEGIQPFTRDIFKGFLAVFLLDMGIVSGKKLQSFYKQGYFALFFALVVPLINGLLVAYASSAVSLEPGNRFLFAVLAASASYIAVPAAMRMAAPKANPSLYLPMALAITFPFNITLGLPLYMCVVQWS